MIRRIARAGRFSKPNRVIGCVSCFSVKAVLRFHAAFGALLGYLADKIGACWDLSERRLGREIKKFGKEGGYPALTRLSPRGPTGCSCWLCERLCVALKPPRHRSEPVACCEASRNRTRCDPYRKRRLPNRSGIVESVCKHIVDSRFKPTVRHWSKAVANALLAVRCCIENTRWPNFFNWKACRAETI